MKTDDIEILITSIGLTKKQIADSINRMNLTASFIFRNQNSEKDETYYITTPKTHGKVVCVTNEKGVSKNRNELFNLATKRYVIFADDDVVFMDGALDKILVVFETKNCDAVKYNVNISNEENKKILKKPRKYNSVKYFDCTDIGPMAYCFSREFIHKNNIRYNEFIGPGTKFIKAGEDVYFIKQAFKKKMKMSFLDYVCVDVLQKESTWFTGFDLNHLVTIGGIYYLYYRPFHILFYIRYLIKYRNEYKSHKFKTIISKINKGKHYVKSIILKN